MGSNVDNLYEENKINIHICQTELNLDLVNILKDSLFPNENGEFKNKIEMQNNKEYIYLKGENHGIINEINVNRIAESIENEQNSKSIVICFLTNDRDLEMLEKILLGITEESLPFVIFVKLYEFSQNLEEIRKLSQINIIKYFGLSAEDINENNTQRTYNLILSKILQIDAYLNERGTLFRNYLFGLMNNVPGDINENVRIDDIVIGNRSTLNIFLFGNPRVGKSRFINLSMNELVSRERCSSEHTTKKFTEYELPIRQNNDGELGQIVLYDSPGLTEDQNVIKEFKDLVKNKLDYFNIRKETAPVLLFFIKKGDGISNTIFDFIKDLNEKKFYIFFIITHAKKNSPEVKKYRENLIHRLKVKNILTQKNLEMLNNEGENILNVNLKEDKDDGEFYGFQTIYEKIFKLFPKNFLQDIEEATNINELNRLLGFITYKNYFFIKNCLTKEDFLSKITEKINTRINISAAFASLVGLNPIPFADIPIVIAIEIGLIRYISKLYGFNEDEVNEARLAALGPWDSIPIGMLTTASQLLKLTFVLDIIPAVGSVVSFFANFGTVESFGKAIQKHFHNLLNDEKMVIIIRDILKDYRSIYLQLRDDLCKREIFNIDQK